MQQYNGLKGNTSRNTELSSVGFEQLIDPNREVHDGAILYELIRKLEETYPWYLN
jgi:hypothetical protein